MSETHNTYAAHKERQLELAALLDEASEAIAILDMNKDRKYLKELAEKAASDTFKIQVVGTFKNGKSTFINSFLGQEVLPAYATPCTAVISEIKFGADVRAVLHFKNPIPSQLPKNTPTKAMEHIRQSGDTVPPIEIRHSEIEDYAVIPMDKDPKEMLMESPYEKIELFWPLELLENGVEIIDSPGLNEAGIRTQVTMGYLNQADAILLVLTADKLCSADEMKFIENNLKQLGYDDIYFIINRFDVLRNDRDRSRVVDHAKMKLSGFTAFGEKGLYFVSALNALDGKVQNNAALYNGSGMPEFEKELSDFLVNNRGKVKLSQPAKELRRILETEAVKKSIPQLRGMLESSLAEMIARRDQAMPRLEKLKTRQLATRKNISKQIDQAIPEIRFHINKFFADLSANVATWVNEYEPATKVGMIPTQGAAEAVVRKISEYVMGRVEEEQLDWQTNTLSPFISDKIDSIISGNEANLENFFIELDAIKVTISGVDTPDEGDIPLGERLLAASAGFVVSGFSGAALGGMEGFSKDFLKGVMVQVGAMLALSFLGLLNPVTLIALIAGSLFFSMAGAGDKLVNKIKEKVAEEIQNKVNESCLDSVEKLLDDLQSKLWGAFEPFLKGMDAEIVEVETQVNRIIEEMTQGQEEINRRKALLDSCEESVHCLISKTDDFISANIAER